MDRIVRPAEVAEAIGITTRSLYRWIESGHFPRPLRIANRMTGWRLSTFEAWLDAREEVGRTLGGKG